MLNRFLFLFAIAAIICTGIAATQEKSEEKSAFTAERHQSRKVACISCHGEEQPKAAGNAEKACVTCHKSLETVAEKTKDMLPNPHQNHMTESQDIECTQCHHGHKEDTPICLNCHAGFTFEKPETKDANSGG